MTKLPIATIYLLLITPGEALAALQLWTPLILALSGVAGTALAVALANYRARLQQDQRIAKLETHLPKRATDRVVASPSVPVAISSSPPQSGAGVSAVGSPVPGQVGIDG